MRLSEAVRAAAGRISWGLGDQAVSSITNFAVGIVVARSLGAVEFGAFSLAWVTYAVVLNLSRGLASDPLAVRYSGPPDARWRHAVAHASGTACVVGLAVGAVSLAVGVVIGGTLGWAFVALGLVLPGLLLQDSWRYAFFAAGQGKHAFLNDVLWGVALIPAMIVAAGHGTVAAFVLAWGVAAAVAAAVGCLQTAMRPALRGIVVWVRQHRDLSIRYMLENVSTSGAAQVRMYGLGAIAGLAAVGAVRGAQLLQGPFLAILMGMSLVSVPEAARVLGRAPPRRPRFCALLGGGQAVAGLLWGAALLVLLPDAAGAALLGSVWAAAAVLILPTTLVVVGGSLSDGAVAGLRALGVSRRSLRTQLTAAAAYVTGGLAGAALDGARGSAWGVAAGTFLGAAVAWWQLRAAMREHLPSLPPPAGNEASVTAATPRLSVGLPVYNGQNYLAEALDALLAQSYEDFELIISDNASTDATEEICRRYAAADPRIRYIRQPVNIGAAPNHQVLVDLARGELFKWASHDDLYGKDLLARCVEALDEHPDVVLCHADMAYVDGAGELINRYDYVLETGAADPAVRFGSLLFIDGGDDEYGVIRMEVLRRVNPCASYHNPGRTLVAEIALHGRFHQVPELLYFRRDHPARGDRNPTIRAVCGNLEPRRRNHSTIRLVVEYILGYVSAVRRSPISAAARRACYGHLLRWMFSRSAGESVGWLRARSVRSGRTAPDLDVPVAAAEQKAS